MLFCLFSTGGHSYEILVEGGPSSIFDDSLVYNVADDSGSSKLNSDILSLSQTNSKHPLVVTGKTVGKAIVTIQVGNSPWD